MGIKEELDRERVIELKQYEEKLHNQGIEYICGIDEVGRGPLAGPLAIGGVVMPRDSLISWVNDSKKVTEKRREKIYEQAIEEAIAWDVVFVSVDDINKYNIIKALELGTNQLIKNISKKLAEKNLKLDMILLDEMKGIETGNIKTESIIKGDAKCYSISVASIIAKVVRDRKMIELDKIYPEYGFKRNKGYGTKEHTEKLKKIGKCPEHRDLYIRNFVKEN